MIPKMERGGIGSSGHRKNKTLPLMARMTVIGEVFGI